MKSNLTYLKKLELFKELDNFKDGQFFAIVDVKAKNHLPQWIQFSPHVFWLKNPEEEKNLETYGQALEFFLRQGISRGSTLYAFGGGATTDFAGYVAATILRGIKWVAVPTTLLAMIDGSIGGKVAVNMPQGKNLVGSFHMPEKVFICGDFLTSLPEKEWMSGKGEVLKYGFLSEEIHKLIVSKTSIEDIAMACANFKNIVVERDFKENGERIYLNLGHTLGHAFEYTLKIPHGHAVAMGLKYMFKIMGLHEAHSQWEVMVKALALPAEKFEISYFSKFDINTFSDYLEQDKKKLDSRLRLVLVKNIGICYVEEVALKDFKAKIHAYGEFKS
ncbi:3-dehydroquinate synthase [Peredibacter starrii]|uniref:3-dehydroquinate synthase family protein n=1 Tax=Peredibacter starrii TaxID=28202 RepID=A0AAX4HPS6_9BACT|nr:3-dehydroquinate synthase family protein [Peredibacter starrii]WPU65168.1 3-dehydroquinate synthase family protein [Peredibacter starrii]